MKESLGTIYRDLTCSAKHPLGKCFFSVLFSSLPIVCIPIHAFSVENFLIQCQVLFRDHFFDNLKLSHSSFSVSLSFFFLSCYRWQGLLDLGQHRRTLPRRHPIHRHAAHEALQVHNTFLLNICSCSFAYEGWWIFSK